MCVHSSQHKFFQNRDDSSDSKSNLAWRKTDLAFGKSLKLTMMSFFYRLLNQDVKDGATEYENHVHEMPFCTVYPFWQQHVRRVGAWSDSHVK